MRHEVLGLEWGEVELSPSTRVMENALRRYCRGRADLVLKCNAALTMLMSGLLSGEVRRQYEEWVGRECPRDLVEAIRYELGARQG